MSAFALISGCLHGELRTHPTKTGGEVTFFTLRVANGSALEYWSVAAFADDVRAELAELPDGAPLSCVGPSHGETYEWNGERRFRLKLTADSVLTLKSRPAKARAEKPPAAARGGRDVAEASWARPEGGLACASTEGRAAR